MPRICPSENMPKPVKARSSAGSGTILEDADQVASQHRWPIGFFHLDRVHSVKLEPLIEYGGHAGEKNPFGAERVDTLFQEVLSVYAIRAYAKIATHLQSQERVRLCEAADVDLTAMAHDDGRLFSLFRN